MISKWDWRSVDREVMADERRKVEPPSNEELLAYSRGELSAEEEARVRERLIAYPELVRALAEPFPREGAEPGDPDYLSDEQFEADWAAMQRKMRGRSTEGGRIVQFWRAVSAIAAVVAVILGLGWWRTLPRVVEPRLVADGEVVLPDGGRGAGTATTVHMRGDSIVLTLPLMGSRRFADYRIAFERASGGRMWRSGIVHPSEDGNFAIVIHRRFAKRGDYRFVVYGVTGEGEQQVATYSVRID